MSIEQLGEHRRRTTSGTRTPPYNLAAEESLLGAMLLSRDAIATGVDICSADDFYKPAHGHVFEAITVLYGQGERADPITVGDQLQRAGLLESVGPATLITLQAHCPATSNAGQYATIVEELSRLRTLMGVAGEITEMCAAVPDDVDAAVDQAEAMVFRVADRRNSGTGSSIAELMPRAIDRLGERCNSGDTITGLPTGFYDLDEKLGGLQPGQLVTVGGRPGMGKTSFGLNIAARAALDHGAPVFIASLEMSELEVTNRLVSAEARIDSTKLTKGTMNQDDWAKFVAVTGPLSAAPIFVDDDPSMMIGPLRARARRYASKVGQLGLVVVDYLQLMDGRKGAENRQVEVAEISRGLKVMARELECPVLALSQLSRNLEMRADKRPNLSDLKESGAIEQDSDVVIFLYRDEVYNPESVSRGMAEVHVAKHRNGPTGSIGLAYLGHYTRFANMARM